METQNEFANYLALISAFVGICSAILAFLSYRKSHAQYVLNKRDILFSNCSNNLDNSYIALTDFIDKFSDSSESNEKRMARDRIVYLLDSMLMEIKASKLLRSKFKKSYGDLGMKISDITYENNFEKIIRDIGCIRSDISNLKKNLFDCPE